MTSICEIFDGPPPARDTYIADHWFGFNPATWRRWLLESAPWPDWLDELPYAGRWPRITRGHLLSAGNAANGGQTADQLLIGAYIWGSGLPAGRGPVRLRRVFDRNPARVQPRLAGAVEVLRGEGAAAAYRQLSWGGRYKLTGLGASFFTKLLYFAGWDSAAGALRPLILDRSVVVGLNAVGGTQWPPFGPWTADQYADYLDWAPDEADRWGPGTTADVVERAVWECGKKQAG